MNLYLLSFLVLFNLNGSKTPNFYPSFLAAKEASKNYKKDLVLFFTSSSCEGCNGVWNQFESDDMATKVFISTIIDGYGFDGAVLLDKYGLNKVPSWVILDYEGQVKQKWAGDWKNPYAKPTAPVTTETASAPVKPLATFQPSTAKSTTAAAESNTKPASTQTAPMAAAAPKVEVATIETITPMPASGFVLQAGYFGSETNAQKLISDLAAKGYQHYSIKTTSQNGSTFYRVISKVYPSENEANVEVTSLATQGIKATVKKSSEIQ